MLVPVELPVVVVDVALFATVVTALVEAGFPNLFTRLMLTLVEPSRCSSASNLVYTLAPIGRVRVLGWTPIPHPSFLVLNPDQA